jgi:hypothetical protein
MGGRSLVAAINARLIKSAPRDTPTGLCNNEFLIR